MTKSNMNPKVDEYLRKAKKWQKETEKLRMIILDCGLTEEFKWGKPCYTFQKSNVVIIQGFKEFCALLFCKGSLLNDAMCLLKQFVVTPNGRFFAGFISSLPSRYSVMFIVRLKKFQITPPLFGSSSFLYLSFRDFGCTQAYSSPSLASRYGWVHITYLDMGQLS